MIIRDHYIPGALLLAVVLLVPADAQRTPQAAAKVAPSNTSAATDTRPALEPKAIDLLKAASSRLAAAGSMAFMATVLVENSMQSKKVLECEGREGKGRQELSEDCSRRKDTGIQLGD